MLPSQVLKVAQYLKNKAVGSECGQEFCRLGCVCSSLEHPNSGPLHCRRPECMFGCTCFKRKITKQMSAMESEHLTQPVYCKIGLFRYNFCFFCSFVLFKPLYVIHDGFTADVVNVPAFYYISFFFFLTFFTRNLSFYLKDFHFDQRTLLLRFCYLHSLVTAPNT